MKKRLDFALGALVALVLPLLLGGGAGQAYAQARHVRMKIDGYLCGN